MDHIKAIEYLSLGQLGELEELIGTWSAYNSDYRDLFEARIDDTRGEFNQGLEKTKEILGKSKTQENTELLLFGLSNVFLLKMKLGDLEGIEDTLEKIDITISTLKPNRTILEKWSLGHIYSLRGLYWMQDGKYELARKSYQQSLEIRMDIKVQSDIASSLNNIGYVLMRKGELSEALSYFSKTLEEFEQIQFDRGIAMAKSNIAEIHIKQGEVDVAIPYLTSAIDLHNKVSLSGQPQLFTHTHQSLANVYRLKGMYDEARMQYKLILDNLRDNGNFMLLAETFFDLILMELEANEIETATSWFEELKLLKNQPTSQFVEDRQKLADALIKKHNASSISELVEVTDVFYDLMVTEEQENYIFNVAALNYIEIKFQELQLFNSLDILNDIEDNLQKVLHISEKSKSILVTIEVLILQSKIELIKLNSGEVIEKLEKSMEIAKKYNLNGYMSKITSEIDRYRRELEKMKVLAEDKNGLVAQIKEADILDYLLQVSKLIR